jgi:hypothetical protein
MRTYNKGEWIVSWEISNWGPVSWEIPKWVWGTDYFLAARHTWPFERLKKKTAVLNPPRRGLQHTEK